MFVLRILVPIAALVLLGLGLAYRVTRDRRYLRLAWRILQVSVVLLVGYGLAYVFGRVLLA
jgi:hypothetical protein